VFKKRGIIRVIIGPPVDPVGRDTREVNEEVQRWIESNVDAAQRKSAAT
jgi:hypothetical protein